MQRDAEYFHTKMDKIDGSGELGKHLLELVQAKRVESGSRERSNSPKKSDDGSKSGTSTRS